MTYLGRWGCEKPGVVEGSLQDTWTRWPLKVPSSKTILWVWDSRTVVAHSKSPYHWGHVTCGTWGWEMADYCRDVWFCMWAWNHVLIIVPGWSARYKPQENMFCMCFVEWWISVSVNGPNRKSSLSGLSSGCCCLSLHPSKQNFLPVLIWQWKGFLSKN